MPRLLPGWLSALGWLGLLGQSACVTVYEAPEPLSTGANLPAAVMVPLPGASADDPDPDQRARREYYGGLLRRLEDAVAERDPAQLESLVAGFASAALPDWLRERILGYRTVAKGLWFVARARSAARLEAVPAASDARPMDELGAPLRLLFTLPAGAQPVSLGGRADDDPVAFLVTLVVDDQFVDGTVRHREMPEVVPLERRVQLQGDACLQLPIALDLPAEGALHRAVVVRVELLPGYLLVDGVRAPIPTIELARCRHEQWPAGMEPLRSNPLATLRQALRRGDPEHFPHVVLAAACMPVRDRAAAAAELIEVVRLGSPLQGQVAMAALRRLFGRGPSVGDRDGWLRYWQDGIPLPEPTAGAGDGR